MATMTPERTRMDEPRTGSDRPRTGFVVLAIVMAALLGFGFGWMVFRDTGTDVPDDVEELLDAYVDAWNEPDGEAAVALMTRDARFYSSIATPVAGLTGEDLVDHIDRFAQDSIARGSITVVGDGPYLVVSEDRAGSYDGTSVVLVVDVDGELLIDGHHWFRN